MDILIGFLLAFLIGGALCALFQLFMMLTKLKPPQVLIIGFSLGAILVPFGATGFLQLHGGAGMDIMVMNGGGMTASTLAALFQGTWLPFVSVFGIFVSLAIIGLVTGVIRSRIVQKDLKTNK